MSLPAHVAPPPMDHRPLRAAVIGTGYLGRFHAMKYRAIDGVELVGIADVNTQRVQTISHELNVKGYADYTELLPQVDLVSVATPTYTHYRIAEQCLHHNVHVLLEKPMTVRLDEADELIELAERNRLVLQVGHLKRFHPAIVALKNSGLLRRPRFIESQRLAPFKSRALDVDVVLDLMIHDVDLILNFVDADLIDVEAVGSQVVTEHSDVANARLKFHNGCVANVTASRVAREATRRLRIFQDNAFISLDFIQSDIVIMERGEGTMTLDGLQVPAILNRTLPIQQYDTLEAEIRAFCDAVRHGTPPQVSGRDGRRALAVVKSIRHAIALSSALP